MTIFDAKISLVCILHNLHCILNVNNWKINYYVFFQIEQQLLTMLLLMEVFIKAKDGCMPKKDGCMVEHFTF